MTNATIGWGGRVYLQDSGGAWVQLDEVTDTPFPDDQVADVKATHMQSPGRREEYVAGLIDGGTGDIVMNWVPSSITDLLCLDFKNSGNSRGLRVDALQADGTYYRYETTAIAKQYKPTQPIDNVKKATLTVRFTGASTTSDI